MKQEDCLPVFFFKHFPIQKFVCSEPFTSNRVCDFVCSFVFSWWYYTDNSYANHLWDSKRHCLAKLSVKSDGTFHLDKMRNQIISFIPKQYTEKLIINKQALWKKLQKQEANSIYWYNRNQEWYCEISLSRIERDLWDYLSSSSFSHVSYMVHQLLIYRRNTREKQKRWANSKVQVTWRNKQNDQKFT